MTIDVFRTKAQAATTVAKTGAPCARQSDHLADLADLAISDSTGVLAACELLPFIDRWTCQSQQSEEWADHQAENLDSKLQKNWRRSLASLRRPEATVILGRGILECTIQTDNQNSTKTGTLFHR